MSKSDVRSHGSRSPDASAAERSASPENAKDGDDGEGWTEVGSCCVEVVVVVLSPELAAVVGGGAASPLLVVMVLVAALSGGDTNEGVHRTGSLSRRTPVKQQESDTEGAKTGASLRGSRHNAALAAATLGSSASLDDAVELDDDEVEEEVEGDDPSFARVAAAATAESTAVLRAVVAVFTAANSSRPRAMRKESTGRVCSKTLPSNGPTFEQFKQKQQQQ